MATVAWIVVLVALGAGLAMRRASGLAWAGAVLAAFVFVALGGGAAWLVWLLAVLALAAVALNVTPLRRALASDRLFDGFKKALPQVSSTEQEALEAGTVWWDGELFSGRPDWKKLLAVPKPRLSEEEEAFLEGPVEELCALVDEWRVTHEWYDLPPSVWQFIKDKGFLGMIIPKEYGGLGFSALAHSEVIAKLSSRSGTAAVTVMVPNSLGPAELLLHYGTEEQKAYYLPRLARGEEIPCFALTGPEAGSDASSIPDFGIVGHGEHEGREVLGIRLTWEKRYITLGPVATLLGLAFRLYDPDRLLGDKEDIGITLALVPTRHPGVHIGRRHLPLNAAFQNGPTWGKDVFIPLDWVIGGRDRVGQGWRMLMECLAAGRSISLPASATGGAKLAARASGAYARVRVQFKTPIGRFEGVEEALARIAGHTYVMDAARRMTAGAVDLGEKPSVVSAICKYHLTERGRQVINDAMDVHGGKGICLGPRNLLGRPYQHTPIGITVEGANILTRSMIIFGQGAIRCHPYVLKEIAAIREADPEKARAAFDQALWSHIGFFLSNAVGSFIFGLTDGRGAGAPGAPALARYYEKLARYSAALAFAADLAMLTLGGSLKRRECISARLGDVLSQLYLGSAVLKRFEDDGRPAEDLPLARWGLEDILHRIEDAFAGLIQNFPNRPAAWLLRAVTLPLGRRQAPPGDRLSHEVAERLLAPSAVRDRLTAGMYLPKAAAEPLAQLERALEAAIRAEVVEAKIRAAAKEGALLLRGREDETKLALELGVITPEEFDALVEARALRREVIMVDDFPPDFGIARKSEAAAQTVGARKTA
ncbi:MAG: acyl-CoA dehydrogenase [Burkholderiales bacterium]|nr:MAG: acyl-CoA dehydrogenase [Burkholderiales bacterium]